jgi:HD-like signal output (HDOD) protein
MIRLLCNGLVVFDRLQNGQAELQDALVSSFIAALIARTLGQRLRRELADEAFVCSLFNRLGRNLVLYYLPEEWEDMRRLTDSGVAPAQAAKRVLGTSTSRLGAAIASTWKFPMAIVDSMAPVLSEPDTPAPDTALMLRLISQAANELCEAAYRDPPQAVEDASEITHRYRSSMALSPLALLDMLSSARSKFMDFAPALGVDAGSSEFCLRAGRFVDALREAESVQASSEDEA